MSFGRCVETSLCGIGHAHGRALSLTTELRDFVAAARRNLPASPRQLDEWAIVPHH